MAAFRLAEVEAAREFAHAEDVEASFDQRLFHWGSVGQLGKAHRGAQIGEEREVLAQRKQRGALWLFVGRQCFPFRASDGTEENRIRLPADAECFLGKRLAIDIDGDAADPGFGERELEAKFLLCHGKHTTRFSHDFGTDAIARGEQRF